MSTTDGALVVSAGKATDDNSRVLLLLYGPCHGRDLRALFRFRAVAAAATRARRYDDEDPTVARTGPHGDPDRLQLFSGVRRVP